MFILLLVLPEILYLCFVNGESLDFASTDSALKSLIDKSATKWQKYVQFKTAIYMAYVSIVERNILSNIVTTLKVGNLIHVTDVI